MLINKNILIDEDLWNRISELEAQTKAPINIIISEALELFIDQSTYPAKKDL